MHTFTDALELHSGGVSRVGRRVLYMLSDADAREIIHVDRRQAGQAHARGNDPHGGQVYPGVIVADWGGSANLQVFLDGTDTFWPTSRPEYRGDDAPDVSMDNSSAATYAPHGRWHYTLDGEELDHATWEEQRAEVAAQSRVEREGYGVPDFTQTWEPDSRGTWMLAEV